MKKERYELYKESLKNRAHLIPETILGIAGVLVTIFAGFVESHALIIFVTVLVLFFLMLVLSAWLESGIEYNRIYGVKEVGVAINLRDRNEEQGGFIKDVEEFGETKAGSPFNQGNQYFVVIKADKLRLEMDPIEDVEKKEEWLDRIREIRKTIELAKQIGGRIHVIYKGPVALAFAVGYMLQRESYCVYHYMKPVRPGGASYERVCRGEKKGEPEGIKKQLVRYTGDGEQEVKERVEALNVVVQLGHNEIIDDVKRQMGPGDYLLISRKEGLGLLQVEEFEAVAGLILSAMMEAEKDHKVSQFNLFLDAPVVVAMFLGTLVGRGKVVNVYHYDSRVKMKYVRAFSTSDL